MLLLCLCLLISSLQIETRGKNMTAPLPSVCLICCLLVQKIKDKEIIVWDTLRQEAQLKKRHFWFGLPVTFRPSGFARSYMLNWMAKMGKKDKVQYLKKGQDVVVGKMSIFNSPVLKKAVLRHKSWWQKLKGLSLINNLKAYFLSDKQTVLDSRLTG